MLCGRLAVPVSDLFMTFRKKTGGIRKAKTERSVYMAGFPHQHCPQQVGLGATCPACGGPTALSQTPTVSGLPPAPLHL